MEKKKNTGKIGWIDLTVEDAPRVRDFYASVVGWKPDAVDMDGYQDFNMQLPESETPAAGVCHARGTNACLPPCWMSWVQNTLQMHLHFSLMMFKE